MAIVKCNNGHFYDDALYRGKCPHCKAESELLKAGDLVVEDDKTVSMTVENINIITESPQTERLSQQTPSSEMLPDSMFETAQRLQQLFDESMGEIPEEEKNKTVSLFNGAQEVIPVTGWLVCVTGKEAGKDYRLHAGKNFVGRSLSMDVTIVGDKTVARSRHCSVIYEPNGNAFYIASESGNVVYLNEKKVDHYMEIQADDRLKIGETELVMVPYCKEDRRWESRQ